jgi:hypothetical protein
MLLPAVPALAADEAAADGYLVLDRKVISTFWIKQL